MYSLLLLALSSFLITLFATPLCRDLFRRFGVVDRPDGGRHSHAQPIPRVGGIPILLGFLGSFAILLLSPLKAGLIVVRGLGLMWQVFPAAGLVFAIGLLDDLRDLKPWQKLVAETAAAGIAFAAGVQVTNIAGLTVPPWLSLLITVVWLVGCANAFNLIDGMDGLATGAGLFATITMLLGALLANNALLALATVALAGSLLGFLRYNFNPASIFLGDSGSLTIGFLLGSFGILWAQKSATVLGMAAPLMALAVPLIDTTVAVARRFLRQQPIMAADGAHIHHKLLRRGLKPRTVALMLYGACAIAASMSILSSVAHHGYQGLVLLVFCGAAWIGVQYLGYVEFGVAGRMFVGGAFRRHLNDQIVLRMFEEALTKASTSEDCWKVICETSRKLGFTRAQFRLSGRMFEEAFVQTGGVPVWQIDIPLGGAGRLQLTRSFGQPQSTTVLAMYVEELHKQLSAKGLMVKTFAAGQS
jgi:UDP-GlcNAc:undecaprenyl-phosphate/decaprenyl-phosphate GlcNAc-1-phosphate transferase